MSNGNRKKLSQLSIFDHTNKILGKFFQVEDYEFLLLGDNVNQTVFVQIHH
jgi:hypothetical protein